MHEFLTIAFFVAGLYAAWILAFSAVLVVIALREVRLVREWQVVGDVGSWRTSPYVEAMNERLAVLGFEARHDVRHVKGRYELAGSLWLSPQRDICVATFSGTVWSMMAASTSAWTILGDGRVIVTQDSEVQMIDPSRVMRRAMVRKATADELIDHHRSRVAAMEAQPIPFTGPPTAAMEECERRVAADLVARNRAYWLDETHARWRCNVLGALYAGADVIARFFFRPFPQPRRIFRRSVGSPIVPPEVLVEWSPPEPLVLRKRQEAWRELYRIAFQLVLFLRIPCAICFVLLFAFVPLRVWLVSFAFVLFPLILVIPFDVARRLSAEPPMPRYILTPDRLIWGTGHGAFYRHMTSFSITTTEGDAGTRMLILKRNSGPTIRLPLPYDAVLAAQVIDEVAKRLPRADADDVPNRRQEQLGVPGWTALALLVLFIIVVGLLLVSYGNPANPADRSWLPLFIAFGPGTLWALIFLWRLRKQWLTLIILAFLINAAGAGGAIGLAAAIDTFSVLRHAEPGYVESVRPAHAPRPSVDR